MYGRLVHEGQAESLCCIDARRSGLREMTQSPSHYRFAPVSPSPRLPPRSASSAAPSTSVLPSARRSPVARLAPRRPQVQCQGQSGHDSQPCRSRAVLVRPRGSERVPRFDRSLARSFLVYQSCPFFRVSLVRSSSTMARLSCRERAGRAAPSSRPVGYRRVVFRQPCVSLSSSPRRVRLSLNRLLAAGT